MTDISRIRLFAKLGPTTYKALDAAATFCKLRGNPHVELVHWLHQLRQVEKSDLNLIIKGFGLDESLLQADFIKALDKLPRGHSSLSDLSTHIDGAVEQAWTYCSVMYGTDVIRSGHLLIGMLRGATSKNALLAISRQFERIKFEKLTEDFDQLTEGSAEQMESATALDVAPGEEAGAVAGEGAKGSALAKYAQDLTAKARAGEIDPVLGRDEEIRQIVDILMRRRQNNPILTGEAGVGKTSVVEGFALRVVKGDVPPSLRTVRICSLDLGALQAGASMKGEFENRLRTVIEEVQSSAQPTLLFIDEAHTLIGAGGAAGTGDAANLLKPALARGKLRTIAATTWAEYKKYFEKDPALTRRFQVVQVDEPDEARGIQMLRGVVPVLEKHHKVDIQAAAVDAAVRLSHRYIPARQLPDKAVSLLDTACARVAVSQHATPAPVEDCQRRIEVLNTELEILQRETQYGEDHSKRLAEVRAQLQANEDELKGLQARWEQEKALVQRIVELRAQAAKGSDAAEAEADALRAELMQVQGELRGLQTDSALVLPVVDDLAVASVVQDWTGIPLGKMVGDEVKNVLRLADTLNERVIGQKHGLEMIAKRIQTSRAKLDNPNKPIGVFMLCGPSGVGKTETALALADTLYGGEHNVITINMSEYQEAHTVSSLKGAPPGYVGYGEGGVLTEAVRRKPYSVVLLDEVEKAHPDVHETFFQVFDKGWMEDGEGRYIDFKNTLILLTSNVGSEQIAQMCADPELMPDPEAMAKSLREPLLKVFPAALLGRIVTIPYFPLSDEMLGAIIKLQLGRIVKRVRANHDAEFVYSDDVVKLVASRCTEVESGGRMIDAILTNTILPRVSEAILNRMLEGQGIQRIEVGVDGTDFTYAIS
ncbi:type VI secretion system ATPase TssH [Inhella proteolytica]|uniref:Type VI secretion system ATPase TssH n=1 Tax=Inhella proteolytica TaxID=2795029 RepID=A0A931J1F8_9BURK|nr:type VI secretion system ATPase TssH [Inhella proteolytica]MBH9577746.1 type VI secretion system ATPase TssH [Inhella proteolytica]